MFCAARGIEKRSPLRRGVGTERRELIVLELADHVEIDHRHHVTERHGRVIDEPG